MRSWTGCPIKDESEDEFGEDGLILLEEKGEVFSAPAAPVQLEPFYPADLPPSR